MSIDIISRLDELVPNPGCIYDAIESILSTCEAPENITERARLAVQLAICDFTATGIDYPEICHNPLRLTECTRLLETKPTWWTTFNGEYQHISQICQEYRPQFESQKILGVFKDASDAYLQFRSEVKIDLDNIRIAKSTAERNFLIVSKEIQDELQQLKSVVSWFLNSSHAEILEVSSLQTDVLQAFQYAHSKLETVVDATDVLYSKVNEIGFKIQHFNDAMESIHQQHRSMAEQLQVSINSTANVLRHADKTLMDSAYIIRVASNLFRIFAIFTSPFGLMLLLPVVVILFRWKYSSKGKNESSNDDIIFL